MTFGVNDLINCINQAGTRSNLTALEILQLTGSECQLNDKCTVFSVACQASLPTASCNTGRFVYVTNEGKYYFSTGGAWTSDVSSITSAVWSWGHNNCGQLGDNTTANKSSPVSVVGGFTDWYELAAGACHTVGLRTNGTLRTWGRNGTGQLGDNTIVDKSSPVSISGGFTDWCQVSAGYLFSSAVRTNGTLWSWGYNNCGQLGDNTTVSKRSPVSVVGGLFGWCQVSSADGQSLAVRTNGTAWGWGRNEGGRLGDNSTVSRSSPVSVVGGFTDWCQISAGQKHSLAVRQNGTAWGWGYGSYGRIGNNCTANQSSPVSVVGGFTNWCQVSGGNQHSLGLRTNGTLYAWGYGFQGQIGDNAGVVLRSSPVSVVGGFTDWCQVTGGYNNSFGMRTNGTLWSWGMNQCGQLGDNTTTNRSSPVSVVGGFTDWFRVARSFSISRHTLAIRKSCGF